MREETTTRTLYTFAELSPEAQEKAIEVARCAGEYFDSKEFVYDDAVTIAALFGLEIDRRTWTNAHGYSGSEPTIYFSGFYSQGDGACFEGRYEYKRGALAAVKAYAPQDTELYSIVERLQHAQASNFYKITCTMKHSGHHYYHSGCMSVDVEHSEDSYRTVKNEDDFIQAMQDFADWIYNQLESAYEYETSEENARQYLENNDAEFTEDGVMI